jgi:hypothetical protein
MHPPYTEDEAREARQWVNKHGPSNSWTAGGGTAARMIGRLLKERERLLLASRLWVGPLTEREEKVLKWLAEMCIEEESFANAEGRVGEGAKWLARACVLDGLLRRAR